MSMTSLVTEQAAFIPPVLSLGSSILVPHHWVWSVLRGWPLSECPDPTELLDSPEAWTVVIALNSSLGGAAWGRSQPSSRGFSFLSLSSLLSPEVRRTASEDLQGWEDFPSLGRVKGKGKVLGWRVRWHRREPGTGKVLKKCSSWIPSYHNSVGGVCHPWELVTEFYFQMQVRPFFLCSKHSQIASFLSFQDENPLLSLEFLMQPELQGLKSSQCLWGTIGQREIKVEWGWGWEWWN